MMPPFIVSLGSVGWTITLSPKGLIFNVAIFTVPPLISIFNARAAAAIAGFVAAPQNWQRLCHIANLALFFIFVNPFERLLIILPLTRPKPYA
jgi:hypothetical protein